MKTTVVFGLAALAGLACAAAGRFSGTAPEGWFENFIGWNDTVASGAASADAYRLEVSRLSPEGPAQFIRGMPPLEKGRVYRLTLETRNRSSGDARLIVRENGAPYRYVAQVDAEPSSEWRTWTRDFVAPADAPRDLVLLLQLDGVGTAEFRTRDLRLLPPDAKVVDERYVLRQPGENRANLLRNAVLPLGLPSGWNVSRDFNDGTVEPALDVAGPSGAPPMKIAGRNMAVCSEPFVPDGTRAHTLSFAVRGEGKWRCEVFSRNRWQIAGTDFSAGSEWTRVTLPFVPEGSDLVCAFELRGSGSLYLDALRVCAGNETEFAQPACTVSLAAAGEGELAAMRIGFEDEQPRFRWRVDGPESGKVAVKYTVTDLNGVVRGPVELMRPGGAKSGTARYSAFAGRGQYRIEAWAEADGARVSPEAELVLTRLARPRHWNEDAPDSPFGVHVNPYGPHLAAAKAAGFNHVRCHDAAVWLTGWQYLEYEPGKWRWYDAEVDAVRAHRLTVLGQLGTAPLWRSHGSKVDRGRTEVNYFDRYFQPLSVDDFKDYVRRVASHYRGRIDTWFVWNEPWNVEWWAVDYDKTKGDRGYITSREPQADFARLCRGARTALKETVPEARMLGLNSSTGGFGEKWTAGVKAAGPLDYCDAVDYHFYSVKRMGFPNDAGGAGLEQAVGALRDEKGALPCPVYMTEGNAFCDGSGALAPFALAGHYLRTVPWKAEDWMEYSDRTVRYLVSNLSRGVARQYLYSMHCYDNLTRKPGILVMLTGDGYPHPAMAAVSALAYFIEGLKFVRVENVRNGLFAYEFEGAGRRVRVISGEAVAEKGPVATRTGEKPYDLFGNPCASDYRGRLMYLVSERSGASRSLR